MKSNSKSKNVEIVHVISLFKTFVFRDKLVNIFTTDTGYMFSISHKKNRSYTYYSTIYNSIHECEKDSIKVCKGMC